MHQKFCPLLCIVLGQHNLQHLPVLKLLPSRLFQGQTVGDHTLGFGYSLSLEVGYPLDLVLDVLPVVVLVGAAVHV